MNSPWSQYFHHIAKILIHFSVSASEFCPTNTFDGNETRHLIVTKSSVLITTSVSFISPVSIKQSYLIYKYFDIEMKQIHNCLLIQLFLLYDTPATWDNYIPSSTCDQQQTVCTVSREQLATVPAAGQDGQNRFMHSCTQLCRVYTVHTVYRVYTLHSTLYTTDLLPDTADSK